jgi:hypothetical protein
VLRANVFDVECEYDETDPAGYRAAVTAVYPDSQKIGVWTPGSEHNVMLRQADGKVDYWDGEH